MTDRVFDGIITALASIGYEKALTWSRYHGAMVDERVSMRASPVPVPPFPAPGWSSSATATTCVAAPWPGWRRRDWTA